MKTETDTEAKVTPISEDLIKCVKDRCNIRKCIEEGKKAKAKKIIRGKLINDYFKSKGLNEVDYDFTEKIYRIMVKMTKTNNQKGKDAAEFVKSIDAVVDKIYSKYYYEDVIEPKEKEKTNKKYKAKILNELKNGKSREFYKNCYMKDYAFDVVVDDMKFEIHPRGLEYWRGAEAVNLKEDWQPIDFTDKELHEAFVQN